ncbi:MAG: metal ABC transporter ATP-binding protein [Actinobacteria bacterium]|nr:metal ABC transporter ATP-binding protein [Actinomycetota bacterium]
MRTVLESPSDADTAVISADAVCFSYANTPVLDCVSFELRRGEFTALVGPNGSGKSTLIRILLGLLPPAAGRVTVLGRSPESLAERWRIGYVPQRPTVAELLPATVQDVVDAGRLARRGWWRRPGPDDRVATDTALDAVGLTAMRHRRLAELSGGQQQRAYIAKALASEPELLVLDEPTAGIDADSQRRFRDALVASRARGATVLLVSHELSAVADDLDRVLMLRHGKVGFDGPPADLAAGGISLGVHATDLPVWLEDHA